MQCLAALSCLKQMPNSSDRVVVTFNLRSDLYKKFKLRLYRHGDRSKALQRLVEMFLNNEVDVKLPSKTIFVPERQL